MSGPTVAASVYVHAPFCARRCRYCDFAVTVSRTGDLPAWSEAIAAELKLVEEEGVFALSDRLRTLYVGGGTPSLLGPGAMASLVGIIGTERVSDPSLEWTAEANPESFTPEVAEAWADAGVNRISLGAQSFSESALRWMGRLHGPDGPVRAIEAARAAGIENVSIDLIFGLPRSAERSWDADLEAALALDAPHVSLYGLSVEPGTSLGRAVREGREAPVDEEQYRLEFLRACERLTAAGYVHYEVSNFARPGMEARHNAVYWQGDPYLGLGNSAHSYARPLRRWNVRDWEEYRSSALQGRLPEAEHETVDSEAEALERIWLDLRTRRGVATPKVGTSSAELAARWISDGLAVADGQRVRLTPEGWLLLDRLAVDLDEARSAG